MTKYKLKCYSRPYNIWKLYKQTWWIFYEYVTAGNKQSLVDYVNKVGGRIINLKK